MHQKLLPALFSLPTLLALAACGSSQSTDNQLADQRLGPVARAIIRGEDRFAIPELAQRLIQERQDLQLLDLRPAANFAQGHIEDAENRPLEQLLSEAGLAALPTDRQLVLYADGTAPAAQAAALLRLAGRHAYALDGGYQGWLAYTRNPQAAGEDDAQARAERQAVACYFEGDYVAAAGLAVRQGGYRPALTPVTPPTSAADSAAKANALGLGLGLGLGPAPEPATAPAAQAQADALGLGLGLGLGPEQKQPAKPKGKLIIGEGC